MLCTFHHITSLHTTKCYKVLHSSIQLNPLNQNDNSEHLCFTPTQNTRKGNFHDIYDI